MDKDTDLKKLFDMVPGLVCIAGTDGYFELLNPEWENILGYSTEELKEHPFLEFIHPDDRTASQKEIEKLISGGKTLKFENRYLCKDGSYKTLEWRAIPAEADRLFAVAQDITERKFAEEALKASEIKFTTVFESNPAAIAITRLNDNRFVSVNKAWEKLTGYKHSEVCGHRPFEFDLWAEPKQREQMIAYLGREQQIFQDEVLVRKKSGEIRCVLFMAEIVALSNERFLITMAQDITDRKQIEAKLRESEELYRDAQRIAKLGHWKLDLSSGTPVWSEEVFRVFGLDPENCVPSFTAHADIVHKEDWPRLERSIQELSADGTPFDIEFRILRSSGETRWLQAKGSAKKAEAGNVSELIGTAQDITDRKNLENMLLQSQKLESIGALAGGIAHDFNNILASIVGYTELSIDMVLEGSALDDNLQEIYAAAKRAKDLVKQILAFARQSEEKIVPIQPSVVVKEVLKLIRSSTPATINIRQTIESESVIIGNATQVHQILMNLCTNAVHAMEDTGGIMEVSLKDVLIKGEELFKINGLKPGGYIQLRVSDTGMGIASEDIGSIFEPYFTTKGLGEGTGMGLAMIDGIVESYGGKITVDSQLGKGATFTIYLPISRKAKPHRPQATEVMPTGTERILFVDDEAPVAKIGGKILGRLGYSVAIRTSSIEALEFFRAKPGTFDLVITDLTMPNMTGERLAVELMKIRPDIPVILCTGYSKKFSDEMALEIGIKAVAYKPMVMADLAKTVRKVLDEAKEG